MSLQHSIRMLEKQDGCTVVGVNIVSPYLSNQDTTCLLCTYRGCTILSACLFNN